jgi:hypothetical protein
LINLANHDQIQTLTRKKRRTFVNTKNLLIASLLGGLASTILSNVPLLNFVNCLLCAGFWAGPLLAVWLYKRQTGQISFGQAVAVGTVAGIWAGVFGLILSLVGMAGAQALFNSYARYLPPDANLQADLPGPGSIIFNLIGVVFNIAFGAIGGLIGGAIFKTKPTATGTGS